MGWFSRFVSGPAWTPNPCRLYFEISHPAPRGQGKHTIPRGQGTGSRRYHLGAITWDAKRAAIPSSPPQPPRATSLRAIFPQQLNSRTCCSPARSGTACARTLAQAGHRDAALPSPDLGHERFAEERTRWPAGKYTPSGVPPKAGHRCPLEDLAGLALTCREGIAEGVGSIADIDRDNREVAPAIESHASPKQPKPTKPPLLTRVGIQEGPPRRELTRMVSPDIRWRQIDPEHQP